MRQKYKGDDVRSRLHGTIIRYKNIPYYCAVGEGNVLHLSDLSTGNLIATVDHDDVDIDISSIPLGFVNLDNPNYKICVYLKREPYRKYKQGVCLEALTQTVLSSSKGIIGPDRLRCNGLVKTVEGKFPSLSQAIDLITKGGWTSVAISRNIAIFRQDSILKIYFDEKEVGWMKLGTKVVNIPKSEFSYFYVDQLKLVADWNVVEGGK